jgi:Uma2 family endonuclease
MTAIATHTISEQEYLAFERASEIRNEYYNGRIYAMTGASLAHNLIVSNSVASLHGQLRRKPCRICSSDLRVHIPQTGLYTYPDLVIVCGEPQFLDDSLDTLLNPTVIVEVLSPSTERYDRGMKFQHYRSIASLQVYLLIAQDRAHIERYTRQEGDLWLLQDAIGLPASVDMAAIEAVLSLADVYEKVDINNSDLPIVLEPPSTMNK